MAEETKIGEVANTSTNNAIVNETKELIDKAEKVSIDLLSDINEFKNKAVDFVDDIDIEFIQAKIEKKANELLEDVNTAKNNIVDAVEDVSAKPGPAKYIVWGVIGIFALGLLGAIVGVFN